MAVLSIQWKSLDRISPVTGVVTPREGEEEAEEAELPRADKPFLVWVQDPSIDESFDKIGSVVLDPDKIRVGSAMFTCVKMSLDQAMADPMLAEEVDDAPALVLVLPTYEVSSVLEGRISSSKLFSAMKKAAKKSFRGNFEKNVKAVVKLLGSLDKVNDARSILKQKEEKGLKPAEARRVAKELEELEAEEKELIEKREELLKMEPRTA